MTARHVLVVDDDEDHAHSLAQILKLVGHRAAVAFSGEEAVARTRTEAFDLVLMDLRLPGMHGLRAGWEIRRERPGLPVVLMTGFGLPQLVQYALGTRATTVLHPPYTLDQVSAALEDPDRGAFVVVADGDASVIPALRDRLARQGRCVGAAPDPARAAELPGRQPPQVLLLGPDFPVVDALEVHLDFSERDGSAPPMLVQTRPFDDAPPGACGQPNRRPRCLFKPFRPEELIAAVESHATDAGALRPS